ncbi:MAG: 2-phospho-L-lactate guanylyltransferase [Novosphingobium sp.]
MTIWVVIPVKAPDLGKQRLAEVLDETARSALVRAMLGKVIQAAQAAVTTGQALILGPSSHGYDLALLDDPGKGLDAALTSALADAERGGASRVVFVAGDLPQVTAREVELLSLAPKNAVAIAPDRHGTGTNAISLPLPAARGFTFAFGPDSFALHSGEVRRMDLELEVIQSHGLMRDIDEPADLPDAAGLAGG